MATRDIIVIGASAGGVEALAQLVATLPRDLPAAVFVTVHFPRSSLSVLPKVLNRAGTLPATHPADGETIRSGRIYVAPPDFHLLLTPNGMRLVRGPTENGNRPAIDPMFRSAAVTFGPRVIGIVLTGSLDDGTAGLMAITRRGGLGVAQDPEEATFSSMPASAISNGAVHHTLSIADMAPLLQRLTRETVDLPAKDPMNDDARREHAYSAFDLGTIEDSTNHPGEPSPYSCPDCGGVLWEMEDGDMLRFRCRVGHGWTNDGLLMQQTETLDTALWMALRALEESAGLNTRLARRAEARGDAKLVARLSDQAEAAERRARVIREALSRPDALSGPGPATGTHG
jgi:two-component system chemotaxis response regulator CheB